MECPAQLLPDRCCSSVATSLRTGFQSCFSFSTPHYIFSLLLIFATLDSTDLPRKRVHTQMLSTHLGLAGCS